MKPSQYSFKPIYLLLTVLILLLSSSIQPAQAAYAVYFVKPTATGTGICGSWSSACTLQTALGLAEATDEIWVMQGTHIPGSSRTDTFQLVSGVAIYGGFDGTEGNREDRDPAANLTILSGDIDGNDSQSPITDLDTVTGNTTNSYHVVTADGTDSTAILDGFTITAGYANGGAEDDFGGGMYSYASDSTLVNLTFSGNYSYSSAGGIYAYESSPTLSNIVFSNNAARFDGGGIVMHSNSSPSLTNITFSGNSADNGGGLTFQLNSNPTLNNVTFSGNSADYGGGIYGFFESTLTLNNAIMWGDTAASNGDEIFLNEATVNIFDSVIEGGCVVIGTSCTNVIDDDPDLNDLADNGGSTQTFSLGYDSSAIDEGGANSTCAADSQNGLSRPQGSGCDIGAYEAHTGTFYAKPSATGEGTCTSWADACTLATALSLVHYGDEVWVMTGTHLPTTDDTDRGATFQLFSGVGVYGGFDGTETARTQRDPDANLTVLSGDIGGDDSQNPITDLDSVTGNTNNSTYVVTSSFILNTAILDGFTITASNGRGIYNEDGSPTLNNLVIIGNSGGGMMNITGDPTLTNTTFSNNAANSGGAVYSDIGHPSFTNVTFDNNSASIGGAFYGNEAYPTFTNVTFSNNTATYDGGGIYSSINSPVLNNVTFSGNSAENGGGLADTGGSTSTLNNVTFKGNSATDSGGGIYSFGNTTLNNVILWGNTATTDANIYNFNNAETIIDSVVQGGCPSGVSCTNVIDANPRLSDLADNGGYTQTMALGSTSSALNEGGANSTCETTDQRGVSRPQGGGCDIGAYEAYSGTYYAKPAATGEGTCTSWADACTLATALSLVHSGSDVWVMAGTHIPGDTTSDIFQLVSGVGVYGGFDGTETLLSQRDPDTNLTILSGDIDGDDSQNPITDLDTVTGNTNNAAHIVGAKDTDNTAILDGFTITAGYGPDAQGSGVYSYSGSPTLNNLTITGNWAWEGAGFFVNGGTPILTNIDFSNNTAGLVDGGGALIFNSTASLTNITFSNNSSNSNGGGIAIAGGGTSTLTNITFYNNEADDGGAISIEYSDPTLNNITINDNSASNTGGGLYVTDSSSILNNVILWGNTADSSGNEVFIDYGTLTFIDSIIDGGCPTGASCTHVIAADPMLGALADNGGYTPTMALGSGSSAVDVGGQNAACAAEDQRGLSRPQGGGCDIGAYEAYSGTFYTSPSGTGLCTSWADACTLATALSMVNADDEVWVMAGTHVPGTERSDTFQLVSGVGVYGGFDGTETLRSERDPDTNITILSGDVDNNDDQNPIDDLTLISGNDTNAYHVVTGSGTDSTAVLDGFTITAGYADGSYPLNDGAGLYIDSGTPTLNDLTFTGNQATGDGGGLLSYNTNNLNITNVTFSNNSSGNNGGGMFTLNSSDTTLNNVTFTNNQANSAGGGMSNVSSTFALTNVTFNYNISNTDGGGMFNVNSNGTLTDLTFNQNQANQNGGGLGNYNSSPAINNATFYNNTTISWSGGGISNTASSNPTLTNVTIYDNTSHDSGGGMFNSSSSPTLNNVTISGNTSTNSIGGGMFNTGSTPTLNNTILWGNNASSDPEMYNTSSTPTITDSVVAGGCPTGASCTNVIDADPMLGALADNGGSTETMALGAGSPAIDEGGINAACADDDQRGLSRPQGGGCDIGAYEAVSGTFYTTPTGDGFCTSWADACTLKFALQLVHSGDEIWVMAGTHVPGTERSDSFQLVSGVGIYGGFAGTETLLSQRDPDTNLTILSGDIDGNDDQNPIDDLPSVNGNDTNAYHVLTASGVDDTAILDGFTITAGYADDSYPNNTGAGINSDNGSPTLNNLVLTGNWAWFGGGLSALYGNPTITNTSFNNNSALIDGGGMQNYVNAPILTNITFYSNTAGQYGGGIANTDDSNLTLTNVTFSNNSADYGGAIYSINSTPTLNNITFSDNSALSSGGGISNYTSSLTLNNVILWGNTADSGEDQIYNSGATTNLTDSVVEGGCPANVTCNNIFTGDPLLGTLADNIGYTKTIAISLGSSALDNGGTNAACAADDQRGLSRPQGSGCDIGAFELDTSGPTVSFTKPITTGDILMQPRARLTVDASDFSGVQEVQFYGYYDSAWHLIDTDTDGSDGWVVLWATFDLATDSTVDVKVVAVDTLNNESEAQVDGLILKDTVEFGNGYESRGGDTETAGICLVEISSQPTTDLNANFNNLLTPLEVIRTKMQ